MASRAEVRADLIAAREQAKKAIEQVDRRNLPAAKLRAKEAKVALDKAVVGLEVLTVVVPPLPPPAPLPPPPPPTPVGVIKVTPSALTFTGEKGGARPAPQTLTIVTPDGSPWVSSDLDPAWYDTGAQTGASGTSQTLRPNANWDALPVGTHTDRPITYRATGNAMIGAASVVVTANVKAGSIPIPPPTETNIIWEDDAEVDNTSSYFETDAEFVRTSGVGNGGGFGYRATFNTAAENAGSLKLAFGSGPDADYMIPVDAGTADYRDIYVSFDLKMQAGWTTQDTNHKLIRLIVFAVDDWSEAAVGHVWSGGTGNNYLMLDPARGTNAGGTLLTSGYNDTDNFTFLGTEVGITPLFDASHDGIWYNIEVHMQLNTPGESDGIFEVWLDGALEAQQTGLNWLGSYSDYAINAIFFENYWNSTAPANQVRDWDNFAVSTARIGADVAPTITTTSLPDGTEDVAYSQTLTATGGNGIYTWAVTVGALPTGLSLNANTGGITGTPTVLETQNFTVQVTSAGLTDTQALSIEVVEAGGGAGENIFNYNVETQQTSLGVNVDYLGGTTRQNDVKYEGSWALELPVEGDDGGNQALGVDAVSQTSTDISWLGSTTYDRFYMRIDSGFSWAGGGKAKMCRRGAVGNFSGGYTGYMTEDGFTLGEAGESNGSGGTPVETGGGFVNSGDDPVAGVNCTLAADSQFHEYVIKVTVNSTSSSFDAAMEVWVDGVSAGTASGFRLSTTDGDTAFAGSLSGWGVGVFFQMNGSASDGGTIYMDGFSSDTEYNGLL